MPVLAQHPASQPAGTKWAAYPGAKPTSPGIGSRVMLFNKQPQAVQPVQATVPLPDTNTRTAPQPSTPALMSLSTMKVKSDKELGQVTADYVNNINNEKYAKDLEDFKMGRIKDEPRMPEVIQLAAVPLPGPVNAEPKVRTKLGYGPVVARLEPGYVVHRRLFFEDKNSERYGWDLGMVQPFVSTAYFYKDVLLWPSHLASNLRCRFDTSAGKCPPGSPVPYLLYPPELTVGGGVLGAAAVIGTVFLMP